MNFTDAIHAMVNRIHWPEENEQVDVRNALNEHFTEQAEQEKSAVTPKSETTDGEQTDQKDTAPTAEAE